MKLEGRGGHGSWRGLGLLLMLFLPSQLIVSVSGAQVVAHQFSNQCVQIGQTDYFQWGYPTLTIGGKPFNCKHLHQIHALGSNLLTSKLVPDGKEQEDYFIGHSHDLTDPFWKLGCPAGWEPDWPNPNLNYFDIDFCPKDIEIRTYLVRQNGNVLRGWLHFEVEVFNDEIEFIYVQTRDEVFNAIGEFVVDEGEQCQPTKEYLLSPTKYQFLPCSAIGLREAKTAGAIFMAKIREYKKSYDDLKVYLPKKELSRGIHFTWKLNEYWCNRHQKFRLDALVWSTNTTNRWDAEPGYGLDSEDIKAKCGHKRSECRSWRKHTQYWLWPNWFGSADIKIDGDLDCSTPAIDYSTGKLSPEADAWIRKSSLMARGEDYMNRHSAYKGKTSIYYVKGCQVDPNDRKKAVTFGGRCREHYYKNVSHDQLQGCNLNESAPEFQDINTSQFVVYSEYVNDINIKRLKQCNQTCEEPDINNPAHLTEIQGFETMSPEEIRKRFTKRQLISFKKIKESQTEERASSFWHARKYHGNICIFLTMFLIPVSNFLIRYYKETFMQHLSLGCAPWLWSHLFVCFAVPTMYRSSYTAMQQNIDNFGTSETSEAYFHRVGGRIFIWVFILMVLLGAVRPVAARLRIKTMALHSLTGFFLYFLAIILVINSTFIPASPTLHECDSNGLPTGFSFTAWMAAAWFIIDLLFHIGLTMFQFAVDYKDQIKRPGFGLPFVPMLPVNEGGDLEGASFRKNVLVAYLSVTLIMTFTTIGANFIHDDPGNCTLGEMSCNLEEIEPNMASSPFGCATTSLKYYAKIVNRIRFNM